VAFTALQNEVTAHYYDEPEVSFHVEFGKQLILMLIIKQSIKHSLECEMGVFGSGLQLTY